jgi:hypothetical protein
MAILLAIQNVLGFEIHGLGRRAQAWEAYGRWRRRGILEERRAISIRLDKPFVLGTSLSLTIKWAPSRAHRLRPLPTSAALSKTAHLLENGDLLR